MDCGTLYQSVYSFSTSLGSWLVPMEVDPWHKYIDGRCSVNSITTISTHSLCVYNVICMRDEMYRIMNSCISQPNLQQVDRPPYQ